jgi:alcohol dehydrogenase class IV
LLSGNPQAQADDAVDWLTDTCAALNIPRLRSYGIEEEQIADLAAKARNASSMKANPITLTDSELHEILARSL